MKKHNAKAVLKEIACALLVGGALLVALVSLSNVFYPKDNRVEFGVHDAQANGVMGEPENTIDVLFLGDSECYSAFAPLEMFKEYGFTSYNCGTHAQHLHYGQTLLHRATRHQNPRVAVVETGTLFREFSVSESIFQTMQDVLPVFEYHNRWKYFTPYDYATKPVHTYTDSQKGYIESGKVDAAENLDYMDDEQAVKPEWIPRLNEMYLQSMIDYCRSIDCELILVSVPSTVNWNAERHKAVQSFADEAGVVYIDLNEGDTKVDIDWSKDTKDKGDHMNVYGARKVSSFIGNYLSEAYDLPDHRKDEAYTNWPTETD